MQTITSFQYRNMSETFLFSSESVNEGHPGKGRHFSHISRTSKLNVIKIQKFKQIGDCTKRRYTHSYHLQISFAIRFLMLFLMHAFARILSPVLPARHARRQAWL
jgi:hypothetical protein